jgi:uncharacterized membrane protein
MFDAGLMVAAMQAWYAADPYAAFAGLYHWDDPNLASDLGQPGSALADIETDLVKLYGYANAFEDTLVWWNDANAIATLIDYMLLTNDRQYLSVAENTFNKGPNAFTVSVNGVEVGGLKLAAAGAVVGAEEGSAILGAVGALVGGVVGAVISFLGGGKSAAQSSQTPYTKFQTPYYDDEGWWALAWIKAYDLTNNPQYLTMAEFLFEDMTNGWDIAYGGGGIFWSKAHTDPNGKNFPWKNAIANELFIAVATRLYLRTNTVSYLTWAEKGWLWFNESGLIAGKGDPNGTDSQCIPSNAPAGTRSGCPGAQYLVYDFFINGSLNPGAPPCPDSSGPPCPDPSTTFWTYNCGVILQALCDLYIITKNQSLLSTAHSIATASIKYFTQRWDTDLNQLVSTSTSFGSTLTERNPNTSVSTCHFKGILMRNLGTLFATDPKNSSGIGQFITNNAHSVLANLNPASQVGKEWCESPDTVDFIRQSAGIDAINAANKVLIFSSPISLRTTVERMGTNQMFNLRPLITWPTNSVRSWVTALLS